MGSQPFSIGPKITTEFFIPPKKITTTKQNSQKNHYRKNKIFKHNDILYIIHQSNEFFGKFLVIFQKNPYRGSDFFGKSLSCQL